MASGPFQGMSIRDAGPRIGAEWNALSPLDKKVRELCVRLSPANVVQKYVDIAQADKERFLREYEQVYGRAPPSRERL